MVMLSALQHQSVAVLSPLHCSLRFGTSFVWLLNLLP
jgi:hypothetical protein